MFPETKPEKNTAVKRKRKKEEKTEPPKKRRTSQRITYVPVDSFKKSLATEFESIIDGTIEKIFDEIEDFHEYNMAGSQQAETLWEKKIYTTKFNMHSEMGALEAMLEEDYEFSEGAIRHKEDNERVTRKVYSTSEPHCGFCTLFLQLLDLPLSKPTKGKYNYASHNNYPLPKKLKENQEFLEHFLEYGSDDGEPMKAVMGLAVSNGKITWKDFETKKYLDAVWEYIFKRINNYLT